MSYKTKDSKSFQSGSWIFLRTFLFSMSSSFTFLLELRLNFGGNFFPININFFHVFCVFLDVFFLVKAIEMFNSVSQYSIHMSFMLDG